MTATQFTFPLPAPIARRRLPWCRPGTCLALLLREASSRFCEADWRHEFEGSHSRPADWLARRSDWSTHALCEGGNSECSYCEKVKVAAAEAKALGIEATKAAYASQWARAFELVDEAHSLEDQFGDGPAYRPALEFARVFADLPDDWMANIWVDYQKNLIIVRTHRQEG